MAEVGSLNMVDSCFLEQEVSKDVRIRLHYQSLQANRLSRAFKSDQVRWSASAYLGEALNLAPQIAMMPFLFNVETEPGLFSFKVRGRVFIEGSFQSNQHWSLSEDDEHSKVWSCISRDVLKVVSRLALSLDASVPKELELEV